MAMVRSSSADCSGWEQLHPVMGLHGHLCTLIPSLHNRTGGIPEGEVTTPCPSDVCSIHQPLSNIWEHWKALKNKAQRREMCKRLEQERAICIGIPSTTGSPLSTNPGVTASTSVWPKYTNPKIIHTTALRIYVCICTFIYIYIYMCTHMTKHMTRTPCLNETSELGIQELQPLG